ncbi:aminotransferase class I/II-fold pyridoxal phosphate-dependent enzyme [Porphyromonas gingivalis]|jgi:glycine C-acetyltransferase|uniref:aminotransferase class I/II-fold pyridoxal phosphate-dependent enzyme n=1 Tax=Porphyromonas gingivalis TaxID=837 RepID=UPI0003AD6B40|nr:aminotransferase class I/II-fold pyridoxal phosphate-dependent enzyme [Porphyromonas gingivalis]ERJ81553.1 putative 8-amino-7-oxononanoate synthase [Porphyromonas gingivalis F0566]SJL20181.1 8-amino-7-oxononanoate synthase [Porphyromonas gingivalis]
MKLDKYNVAQSSQSIEELTKEFFQYHENYKDEVGQIYWKESNSSVSSKMSLRDRTSSRMVSFVSNDYLGLSQHPLVQSDAIRAINQFGTGFCAAPSIGGYSSFQKRLEDGLSALLHTEDTLVFNSGFSTNIGVFSALAKPNDIVFLDKGVHRSVFEGVKHCTCKILPHNDPEALNFALQRYKVEGSNLYVVMDGVYSQDGDRGMVQEYLEISQKHGALLIVDDAHGIGVLGESGAGLLEELNLLGQVPLVTGTLSKAFGSIGGYVSGRKDLIDYIRYYAGSCCFSVSLPPPCLAAALKSLELIQKATSERNELLAKAQYAREKLQEAGFSTTDSTTPIIGILTPSYDEAILWAERLLRHDVYIVPIGYPAVSKRYPRLRVALSSMHSYRDIDLLISKLRIVSNKNYQYNMPRKRRSSAEIAQLIDKATEDIVREKGFGGLSIQEVCDRAEIEPALFYRRYPEGFAFYVEKFIRDHDFWFSHYEEFPIERLNRSPEDLTQILLSLWTQIVEDGLLGSLLRLELQDSPLDAAVEIAKEREIQTEDLVNFFAKASESPDILRVQLAILTAGVQYLALHKDVSTFCGIDFARISRQDFETALLKMANGIVKK